MLLLYGLAEADRNGKKMSIKINKGPSSDVGAASENWFCRDGCQAL